MITFNTTTIENIEDEKVKSNVNWAINKINENESKNIIIFARNASGKTTLSNSLSGDNMHYHDEYIRFDSESSVPHMILGSRVRKFTFNDKKIYGNILKANAGKSSLGRLVRELKNTLWYYKGSASVADIKFLKSINSEIINEAKNNFDPKLYGEQLVNDSYINEGYYCRPYVYINRGAIKIKFQNLPILFEGEYDGDGTYIKGLLNAAISDHAKNGIYALILLLHSHWSSVKELINYDLDLIISNINTFTYYSETFNLELLEKIQKRLIDNKIIKDGIKLFQDDKGKLMFKNEKNKNITMDVFKVISKGQHDLLSMVFFNEVNRKEDLVIIDDPFDSLDYINTYEMIKLIRSRENNKRTIILFHSSFHFLMLKQYLTNVNDMWAILYMNIQEVAELGDVSDSFLPKIKYIYEQQPENYGCGIFLLMRYIKDNNSMNTFIYHEVSEGAKKSILDKIIGESKTPNNQSIYLSVLEAFDKIVEIKKWAKEFPDIEVIRNKIKNGVSFDDNLINLYSRIYFILNDLSHNNKWGLDIFDVVSYKEEIQELYDAIKSH